MLISSGRNGPNVWVAVAHHTWWPSFVARLDASGHATPVFINAGHIQAIEYLRNASGSYLLAGGNNNEYDGAILAVLKEDELPASSP